MLRYAPIIIPTLCRSTHFIRLIDSLKRNSWAKYTEVYVGLDYPPSDKYVKGWQEINDYLNNGDFSAFASVHVIRQEINAGVYKNAKLLQETVLKEHDRYIFSEDDNEFSPNFIEYMDKCLDEFEEDNDVVCVSGFSYPVDWAVSQGANCIKQNFCAAAWGIGYWRNKREMLFDYIETGKMLDELPRVIKDKKYLSMIDASLRDYITAASSPFRTIGRSMQKPTDVAVRAALVVDGKYVISPVLSKVRNHGFDGSGTFSQSIDSQVKGNTAGTYDYSNQPIDERDSFDVCLNELDNLDENRKRLNAFDVRSKKQMRDTRILLWLMTHIGIWSARIYYLFRLPFIYVGLLRKKI